MPASRELPSAVFLTYKRGFPTIRASSDSPVAQW